nr:hypothetical protein Itr_chr12CG01370 [Ipomoea trifida]
MIPRETRESMATWLIRFLNAPTADSCGSGPSKYARRLRIPPSEMTDRLRLSLLEVRFCRHSAAYSFAPRRMPPSRRLIVTLIIPSSTSTCRTSGTAEMFFKAQAAAA